MSKSTHVPVIDLALFEYIKAKKTLQLSSEPYGMPQQFRVKSRTGRVVTFVVDQEDMMANEFYDGEACSYKPTEDCNIIRAFIVNQW